MLQLKTFGTLDLPGPDAASADSLLSQPKSTALLVYLLLARPRGYVSRDRLCLLFWPDSDEEHARGALSQALTRIRRFVGSDVLQARGKSEIRILPGSVECDVLAFEEAVAAGNYQAAGQIYGGPFLSGFHAPNAPGFEEWAETERERLRRMAVEAARGLTHQLIGEDRLPEAARVASRALTLAPESEAVAAELVLALAEAGDRPGALHLYDAWTANLERELDLEPGEDLQTLAEELREKPRNGGDHPIESSTASGRADGTWAPSTGFRGAGEDPLEERASEPWTAEDPSGEELSSGSFSSSSLWPRPGRRGLILATAALVVILVAWGASRMTLLSAAFPVDASGRAIGGLSGRDWLLVADVQAPSVDPGLALAFQTLLARDVESAGYTSVVGGMGAMSRRGLADVLARMRLPPDTTVDAELACEMAEREGAAGVLSSRLLPLGPDFVLEAYVLSVPDCTERIQASALASFDELSVAVTALSHELRARLGESQASIRRSPPLPPITTSYVGALRAVSHYLDTPELWEDETAGVAAIEEALRIEPDFAFAHFLLALHYQRLGRFEEAVPHLQQAYAARSQLPRQGQLGMEAIHQRYLESDPRAAIATVSTLITDYPAIDDATLPFLADAAAWVGDWQQSLEVSMEHLRKGPVGLSAHLSRERAWTAAWGSGQVELADSLFQAIHAKEKAEGLEPDRTIELLHHLRHRDWTAAEAYCAQHPLWNRCGFVYLARGKLRAAARIFQAGLSDNGPENQPLDRIASVAALSYLESASGRPGRALNLLQSTSRSMGSAEGNRAAMHLTRFLICGSAAVMGRSSALPACAVEEEDPEAWDADPSFAVLLRSGAWSRRLLALRSLERGNAERALDQERDAVESNFDNPGLIDHLILARAFDALSQPDSALSHYVRSTHLERDVGFPSAAGILFPLAPVYRRIGELAETSTDTATAVQYYRAFLDLWAEADPELQPQVEAVRSRLGALNRP
jgi:DNA-binding SARP family transcriptional activator/tetratricopeptide (TPR) repeat protein